MRVRLDPRQGKIYSFYIPCQTLITWLLSFFKIFHKQEHGKLKLVTVRRRSSISAGKTRALRTRAAQEGPRLQKLMWRHLLSRWLPRRTKETMVSFYKTVRQDNHWPWFVFPLKTVFWHSLLMISESRATGKSNAATRAGTMKISCYSVRLCTSFWFPVRPFSFLQPAGRTVSRRRRRLDERLCEEGRAEGSREEIHPHSSTLECLTEAPVPDTGDARYRLQPLGGRIRGGSPVWISHQRSEPASCVSAAARSSTDGQMKSRPKPASSSALGCNATG